MNEYVEVPWQKLSPEALQGMLEEMVTRDGTDYGESEVSLEEKISQLRRALESNKAIIVFTPETESWAVIARD